MTWGGWGRKLWITCEGERPERRGEAQRGPAAALFRFMDVYDVVAAVGIGLVGVGCWLVYPPLAFVAVGTMLIVAALVGARASGRGGR